MDDENIRNLMAFSISENEEDKHQEVIEKALRALNRPESERYRDGFLRRLQVEPSFKNGIPNSDPIMAFPIDHERLERSIIMIAIGMMHHVFDTVEFGKHVQSRFLYPDHMDQSDQDTLTVIAAYEKFIRETEPKSVGGEVFKYYNSKLRDYHGETGALWAFHFYNTHWWIGHIVLAKVKPSDDTAGTRPPVHP